MTETRTCLYCRGDITLGVVPEAAGRYGDVRVRAWDLPVLHCTYCKRRSPRYADFIGDTARVLAHICGLPAAIKVGLFVKQPGCSNCRALLHGAEMEPVSFPAELEVTNPPFRVELTIRAATCPKCGTEQFHSEEPLEAQIAKAVQRTFDSLPIEAPA